MRTYIFLIMLLFTFFSGSAQLTDLARVEYTYFPQSKSDNSFKRFRSFVNVPIKVNDKGTYFVPGISYSNVRFDYEDMTTFEVNDLDNFHAIELSLGYTFKLKNDWRFATKLGTLVASNFAGGGLESDDVLFSGSVYMINDKTKSTTVSKPWRLIIGLQYSTTAGRPFPLPFINYYRRFHPSWSYALGVPKSNIKYFITPRHILQGFATLDGFFANIRKNKAIAGADTNSIPQTAENISMTIALAGLGYEYFFTKHLALYTYGGYTLLNDIRLRDANQNNIFTINDANSFYIRGGLKFKI